MPITTWIVTALVATATVVVDAQPTPPIEPETTVVPTTALQTTTAQGTTAPQTTQATTAPQTTTAQPGTTTGQPGTTTTQPGTTSAEPGTTTQPGTTAPPEECPYETFLSSLNVETLVFLEDVWLNDNYLYVQLTAPSKWFDVERVSVGDTTLEAGVGGPEEIDDCFVRWTLRALWEDVRNETDSIGVWTRNGEEIERVSVLIESLLVQNAPDEFEGREFIAKQSGVFDFEKRQIASTEINLVVPEGLQFMADIVVLEHSVRFDQDGLQSTVEMKLATSIANPYQLNSLGGQTAPEMELNINESGGCDEEEDDSCVQQFDLTFSPMNCTALEVNVRLDLELACQSSANATGEPCELPTFPGGGDFPMIPVVINFRATSDMCPVIRTHDTSMPKLSVFSDAGRSQELEDGEFSGENPLYFLASIDDPGVQPYDVQITNILMFKPNGGIVIVWDGGDSSVQDFQIDQLPGTPMAEFSFLPSNPPFDFFGRYFLTADLDVTYVPGQGGNNTLLEAGLAKKRMSSHVSLVKLLEGAEGQDSEDAAAALAPWIVAVFVIGMLLM